MSRKQFRRTTIKSAKQKIAGRHPGNTRPVMPVTQHAAAPSSASSELAQMLDKEWFRSHPHRTHRIRRAIPGEMLGVSAGMYIVVRQVAPGLRMRGFVEPNGPLPADEAPEHIAHALFDLVLASPRRFLPFQELLQQSRAYEVLSDPEDPSRDKPLRRH
jgi:hypothetical protein